MPVRTGVGLSSVTALVEETEESAELTALMVRAFEEGSVAGATYLPEASMVPREEDPPAALLTSHETAESWVPLTTAEKVVEPRREHWLMRGKRPWRLAPAAVVASCWMKSGRRRRKSALRPRVGQERSRTAGGKKSAYNSSLVRGSSSEYWPKGQKQDSPFGSDK